MNTSNLCGSIFIKSDAPLPEWFDFCVEDWRGWMRVADFDCSSRLEVLASRTGWHFSYITTTVEASAFDPRREGATNRALRKIMRALEHSSFNAFEITQAASHRALVLYHANVVVNPRHLWPNAFLHEPDPHHYTNSARDFKLLFQKAAEIRPRMKMH